MSLKSYILTRVLLTVPTILILVSIVFLILHIIPGNPVNSIVGPNAPESLKEAIRRKLGLDQPLYIQYASYVYGIFTGNFGTSVITNKSIISELETFFPATVELALGALVVMLLVGVPLGFFSAVKANSKVDFAIRIYSMLIYAVPIFWLGLILQLIFGVYLHLLPVAGMGIPPTHLYTGVYIIDSLLSLDYTSLVSDLKSLILPASTLGLILAGVISRLTRTYMIDSLGQDYTTAARSRGLHETTVLISYGFKNALIPFVTIVGLEVAGMLGGTILTESTFSWPGIGLYLVQRIALRDYNAVQGTVALFAVIVVVVNTLVDIIYSLVDPRVKL
jgi:peptide/nickel transport system permease protein